MLQRLLRFTAFLFLVLPLALFAQMGQDLSRIRVDDLSDAQVKQFVQQVRATGMSDAQLEQVATARGMSATEVGKLRSRVEALGTSLPSSSGSSVVNRRLADSEGAPAPRDLNSELNTVFSSLSPRVFGHDLFRNANPQFVPNLKIATPKSYTIGTGDELLIDIYGDSEASYQLTVSPEGQVNIPYVGVLSVAGTTIDQVTSRIEQSLSTVYSGIRSGRTQVALSIGNMRSIQVVLTGELVQPGTYTLPSVATVFNALYAAGGPNSNGSLRNIQVYRNNRLISQLDIYDFLLQGSLENNITLQDQDIIQVSPADQRIYIGGEVQRPMYFDAKEGDRFSDLLRYAGGFTDQAYRARVSVERVTSRERRIEDILESQYSDFAVHAGDRFRVGSILNRFENRVQILGAVFNPGAYELTPGLSLSVLIKKADGVKEDAFLRLGYIDRRKDNLELERINFNVAEVLAGTQTDILLKKEDIVHIRSIRDLKNEYTIRIEGEVRNPGSYPFAEGSTIKDLILQAGGFTESASRSRIEVSRRVLDSDPLNHSASTAQILHVDLDTDLNTLQDNMLLQPFDFITVRSQSGYETQKNVRIEGEVLYPGIYTIQAKDERISHLIERAGGLTAYAYAQGGSLKRAGIRARSQVKSFAGQSQSEKFDDQQEILEEKERMSEVANLVNAEGEGMSSSLVQSRQNDYVGIRIDEVLKNPESIDNIFLEEGDVLYIPKQLQTVRINGEVLSPVNTVYRKGLSFKDYISQAGGYSPRALKKRAYIVYANGSARGTKSFLGIKSYPQVEPGAEIFVPQRPEREKLSAQAWIGMGTGVASLAAIIVSLLK